jgi:hypothetical protein
MQLYLPTLKENSRNYEEKFSEDDNMKHPMSFILRPIGGFYI